MDAISRFMKFVEISNGHWIWKGGNFTLEWSAENKKSIVVRPRHAAAILFLGMDQSQKFSVRAACGNADCVNPHHLICGDKNKLDVSPCAKLNSRDVAHIKKLLVSQSPANIAKMYDVDRTTIYQIKAGRNWKDAG